MPDLPPAESSARLTKPAPVILYVVTEDWYFWLHRLALGRGALAAGYEVVIAARVQEHRARLEAEGFRVVALPWRRRGGKLVNELRTIVQLWQLCRRLRPALVHSIALKPILYGGTVARLAGRTRLATVAGLGYVFTSMRLKARLLRPLVTLALGFAMGGDRSLVTLENPADGDTLAKDGALDPGRIALITSCGVDCRLFAPAPEPAGPVTVGMACRLVRDKGPAVAVEAVRLARAAGADLRFLLAGSVDPDSPDSHTQDEVDRWVSDGLVEWVGQVTEMPGFWQRCHIGIYPSRYGEGLPRTLLEAAACGLPVVTTDMPGCRDALIDGETGYLVEVDDAATLAQRLAGLASNPEQRRRMGQAGRALMLADFDDPVVVERMTGVYRRATQG